VNVFYVSIRATEDYEFDKIRTLLEWLETPLIIKTARATILYLCSTRDEISQPSRPVSPRAATSGHQLQQILYKIQEMFEVNKKRQKAVNNVRCAW